MKRSILLAVLVTLPILVAPAVADSISDAKAGLAAVSGGNYGLAIQLFTRAIQKGDLSPPDQELAYVKRGQAYLMAKKNDLARADLDRALKMVPGDREALDLRSKAGDAPKVVTVAKIPGPAPSTVPPVQQEPAKSAGAPASRAIAPGISPDSKALDLAAWNAVKDSTDSNVLRSYLDTYPKGVFAAIAKAKITSIDAADESAYAMAKGLNTVVSYNTYLATYPNGRHGDEAKASRLGLMQPAAQTSEPNPIVSTHTLPPYPQLSKATGEHGTTVLKISIGSDGRASDATVQSSSGSDRLDSAAIDYVKAHWRWKPAMQNGQSVSSNTVASIVWSLDSIR